MTSLAEKKRPIDVTVVAILYGIMGALNLDMGTASLTFARSWFATIVGLSTFRGFLVLSGILFFVSAYGFWVGNSRALELSVLAETFGLVIFGGIISDLNGEFIGVWFIGGIICSLFYFGLNVYYLDRPRVKAFLGKA